MNPKAKLKKQADKLRDEVAFKKYGTTCEICNGTYKLHPHHFYYKATYPHLRFDLDNAVVLCWKCHFKLHHRDPKLVEEQIVQKRGEEWYQRLKEKAYSKPTYSLQTIDYYQKTLKRLSRANKGQ